MAVSAVSNTSYTDVATASSATNRTVKKTLGQEDFLKLLATQFQSQDPMKPMEDTAFIANMAQFSSLEQTSLMTTQLKQLLAMQDVSAANSYIGRQVTLQTDKEGNTLTGTVEGVEMVDGEPRLVLGDKTYPISSVLLVEPAPASASAASTGGDSSATNEPTA